jgi:biotin synthase
VKRAKQLGLEVCCGGVFGLGESWAQRAELAETLRELKVDSVPLNFLNPIPGTPLEKVRRLTPLECLQIIALFRLMLPATHLQVCGGRQVNLRDLQSLIFAAGADGMMIGNYLTTAGRPVEDDLRMIADLGLEPEP